MSASFNKMDDAEIQLIHPELFQFLTPSERETLLSKGKKIKVHKGEILTKQGDEATSFFVILTGKLKVTKHAHKKKLEHTLSYLNPGDIIGEMALIDTVPRGFTLKAVKLSHLLEFSINDIKQFPEISSKLNLHIGKRIAKRLRYLSEVTVKAMEKELQESKKRNALGLLMITVLSLTSAYMLSLKFLERIKTHLPVVTIISAPLVIIIVAIMVLVMKKSGFPWKTFGISTKNWRSHTVEAILFSIPVMLILTAIKWVFIHRLLKDPSIPLIDPASSLYTPDFSLTIYIISLIIYIILAPLQELVARGALQSGFYLFIPGKEKSRTWTAIILSNLMFSLPHLYNSLYFAIVVLIPGFFWGWLFSRQKTLVGVSVSHILIGVWMAFIVGFEQLSIRLG